MEIVAKKLLFVESEKENEGEEVDDDGHGLRMQVGRVSEKLVLPGEVC